MSNETLLLLEIGRLGASFAVCWLGIECMKITKGETGIGWALFGIVIIWS